MFLIDECMISVRKRNSSLADITFNVSSLKNRYSPIIFIIPNFYMKNAYPINSNNWITDTETMIEVLNSIMLRNDFVEFDFSLYNSEHYITVNSKFVEIERYGFTEKIKIQDFIKIFIYIKKFLKRWKSKTDLLSTIRLAFKEMLKHDFKETTVFDYVTNEKDKIRLLVIEDQLNMDPDEYVNSLKLPVHMLEIQSNSDESE